MLIRKIKYVNFRECFFPFKYFILFQDLEQYPETNKDLEKISTLQNLEIPGFQPMPTANPAQFMIMWR